MKFKWDKPQLTIIQQTKSDEAILTLCKRVADTGADNVNTGCYDTTGVCACCDVCSLS